MSKQIETVFPDFSGLFDSHAHYFDDRFDGQAEDLLEHGIFGKGVAGVINVATNPENALRCVEQAKRFPRMYAAVGIHPEDCKALTGSVEEEVAKIRALMESADQRKANKIIALGEIGLDYYWEPYEKEKQMLYFERQLTLAEELDLPVLIHDREAHGDCFETVLRHPKVRGVFHSFSGSAEMAKELIELGYYISFSGTVTFKNAERVRKVASALPPDRLLIETDCPYLSPDPYRGRLNHSGRLSFTLSALASAVGIEAERYAETVYQNTLLAYRL